MEVVMKKLSIILFTVLILSVTGCSRKSGTPLQSTDLQPADESANTYEQSEASIPESDSESADQTDWQQFLNDYESWVDRYIEVLKKYAADPTDMSILSEYTDMISELDEWQSRSEEVQQELDKASPEELAQYSKELLRIASKISEAAY